ncbi:MAG: cytochrome C oxidase subunit IV family protein [Planctomycetota bacterium]
MSNGHDELRQPEHVNGHDDHDHDHGDHEVHVIAFWPMFWCFLALVVLTFLTVWTSNIHYIGEYHISKNAHFLLAIAIATVKTVLVAGYFMHLFYDKLINTAIVVACLFAVLLFIGFSAIDVSSRQQVSPFDTVEIVPGGTEQIVQKAIDKYKEKKHEAGHGTGEHEDDHAGDDAAGEGESAPGAETDEPTAPNADGG